MLTHIITCLFILHKVLPKSQILTVPTCKQSYAAISAPSQLQVCKLNGHVANQTAHYKLTLAQVLHPNYYLITISVTIREPIQLSRLATGTVKTGVEFGMQSNMQCEQKISPRQISKEYQNLM